MALLLAAGFMLVIMSGASAGDDDHEAARRALEQGRALPLPEIIAKVAQQVPGKVIDVELEDEDGTPVYDLKVLSPQGRLQEIEVEAATGKILKIEDDD
jgi:uncharacterized membrane protein YkoI